MRLLADECVDDRMVEGLRAAGYDVASAKSDLRGATDENLLEAARTAERTLITEDKDFGQLAVGQRLVSHGIILVRARGLPAETVVAQLLDALEQYGNKLDRLYLVIDGKRTRVRRLYQGAPP